MEMEYSFHEQMSTDLFEYCATYFRESRMSSKILSETKALVK